LLKKTYEKVVDGLFYAVMFVGEIFSVAAGPAIFFMMILLIMFGILATVL